MAPEQRAGGTVTAQADQYSFCVALREALMGDAPRDSSFEDRFADRAPRFLRAVIARGLDSDPDQRFPSMAALLEALERGEGGQVNAEAYDLVLRARYLSDRTTDHDSQKAIEQLERAVALDPTFAPAYAALAAARVTRLSFVGPDLARDLEEKAFAATERARELDPDLAETYLARGDLLWTDSQRFAHERAAREFHTALNKNPRSDQAHARLARVYVHVGLFDEALQHAAVALEINPTNAQPLNTRAEALLWMGKDEEALATYLSIPEGVLPELVEAHTVFVLQRLNRRDEASRRLQRAVRRYPNDASGNLVGIEALLVADSDPAKALALIDRVENRSPVTPAHHAAYFAACAFARMQRRHEAVDWLRRAAETGFPCHAFFAHDPNLDAIRDDPGFQSFMADLLRQCSALQAGVRDRE